MSKDYFIHSTADVSEKARIGANTKIWNWAQVRENAKIGENCIISKSAYIDYSVKIGNNVKIQNNVSVYFDAEIKDGVFVGPHVCFTNDKMPRAINPDESLKSTDNWRAEKTIIGKGASIGANSTILPGVKIGSYALVGAGSVVTKDVPDYALVFGNPARIKGFVCKCGERLTESKDNCRTCKTKISDIDESGIRSVKTRGTEDNGIETKEVENDR